MGGHRGGGEEKYEWPKANVASFVDIIYEKVKQNKLQTSTFTIPVWEEINREMVGVTKMDYGVDRLKSKWQRLKLKHRLFSDLLSHTGVTLDPDTGLVNAPEEVWGQFFARNKKEYKAIRKEGCDHYHILGEIFGGSTATGGLHFASTQAPPTSDEERRLEDDFLHMDAHHVADANEDPTEEQAEVSNGLRRRNNGSGVDNRRRKEPKMDRVEKCIEKLAATVSSKSAEREARQRVLQLRAEKMEREAAEKLSACSGTGEIIDPYSMHACMHLLNNMESLPNDKFVLATRALNTETNRIAFVMMSSDRRMAWIEML